MGQKQPRKRPSSTKAKEQLKSGATAVYVTANQTAAAVEEAADAESPLVLAV